MPEISVIIPVFNVEKYLPQCLDSIINQTLHDIEIICVDDGSTDNSYIILQEYAIKDNRLIVLRQENSGAGVARNNGMKIARGKYLSILDADDYFELDMLEKAYFQCEKDKADICVFRSDRFDTNIEKYEPIPWTIKQVYLPSDIPFSAKEIYPYVFQIFNGWSWDKLYLREFVEATELQFQGLQTSNDAFFVFLATIQANRITILNDIFAHHRSNNKASLSLNREKSWECCWLAIKGIKAELCKRNQFEIVEKSFINWSLHFLLWNVHTLQEDAKTKLVTELKNNYFVDLELDKYPKDFFYDQREYREYLQICQTGKSSRSQMYIFRRVLQHCKENGFKATIKRIISRLLK